MLEREIDYIPIRFILAILLIVLETVAVIGITLWCGVNIPYFYILMFLTEIFCVLRIINSKENPDYKIPWLVFVLVVPVAGFMIYFMFYNRMLSKKQIKRNALIQEQHLKKAASGVEVRVLYDDIGCMMTLPGDYYKTLQSYGIKAVSFARLRGQANNECKNTSRRICSIFCWGTFRKK